MWAADSPRRDLWALITSPPCFADNDIGSPCFYDSKQRQEGLISKSRINNRNSSESVNDSDTSSVQIINVRVGTSPIGPRVAGSNSSPEESRTEVTWSGGNVQVNTNTSANVQVNVVNIEVRVTTPALNPMPALSPVPEVRPQESRIVQEAGLQEKPKKKRDTSVDILERFEKTPLTQPKFINELTKNGEKPPSLITLLRWRKLGADKLKKLRNYDRHKPDQIFKILIEWVISQLNIKQFVTQTQAVTEPTLGRWKRKYIPGYEWYSTEEVRNQVLWRLQQLQINYENNKRLNSKMKKKKV